MTRRQFQKMLDRDGVKPEDDIMITATTEGGYVTETYDTMADIRDHGWEDDGRGGFYYFIDFEN